LGKLDASKGVSMSNPESGDRPFKQDEDEPEGTPVADPDAVAIADEDAETGDDAATDVVLEDPK
jgi:hypothetical protein